MGKKLKELRSEVDSLRAELDLLWTRLGGKPAELLKPAKPAKAKKEKKKAKKASKKNVKKAVSPAKAGKKTSAAPAEAST